MLTQLSLIPEAKESNPLQLKLSPNATISYLTVAEYFAGIGLVRMGLERAGWRVIFANDYESKKYDMYASYYKDAPKHYKVDNVFKLNYAKIPQALLATSSFPCTDLSLAGNLEGINGENSSAFWGFINVLKFQKRNRPRLIMLENVPGWLTSNKGKDFRITIKALNELGYACEVFHVNALHFTPQSRVRVFVVGILDEKPNLDFVQLEKRPSSLASLRLKKAVISNNDLAWHFLPLPLLPAQKYSGLASIIENIPDYSPQWWGNDEVSRHLNMMQSTHRERVARLSSNSYFSFRTMYRRRRKGVLCAEVRKGDTAGCLRTAKGGSSRQMLIKAGNNKIYMRHMTPREYARLQGVPDEYPLPENTIQALNGFGDAVCVPVISWIGANILNPLVKSFNDHFN